LNDFLRERLPLLIAEDPRSSQMPRLADRFRQTNWAGVAHL